MAGHRVGVQGAAGDHAGGGSRLTEVSCEPFPHGTRSPSGRCASCRICLRKPEDPLARGGPVAAFAVAVMWWVAVRVP